MTDLLISGSAIFSDCGLYRYRLERILGGAGIVAAIIGVNPSTADAHIDDHTIRKDIGFARRLGWSRVIKGNVFAFRATDVRALRQAADPVGPQNTAQLGKIFADADIVVPAWGPLSKLPPALRDQWRRVVDLAEQCRKPLYCWGVAKDGHPRHPLMLAYDTPLVEWRAPS